MYEKDQLRDYIEKFALNYMQLLVHPNPPSLLFGADKDTGLDRANIHSIINLSSCNSSALTHYSISIEKDLFPSAKTPLD